MADGSLKFDTKIDTDGFKDGISTIERAAQRCAKTAETTGEKIKKAFNESVQTSSLKNQIAQTEERIRSTVAELKNMRETKLPTEEYKELSNLVEKTQVRLDRLLERQEKLESQGVSHNSSRWKSLQYDIDEAAKRLKIYKAELKDTVERDRAYTSGVDSEDYAKKTDLLENLNNKLYVQKQRLNEQIAKEAAQQEKLNQKLEETKQKEAAAAEEAARLKEIADSAQVGNEKIVSLNERLQELQARQKELQTAGIGIGYQEYDSNSREIGNITAELKKYKDQLQDSKEKTNHFSQVVKSAFLYGAQVTGKFGKAVGVGLANQVKKASASLKNFKKSSNGVSKSILRLSNMFKLMMIRMVMRAAIQGVREGMQNLVQYSSAANQSMSELTSGMTYVKNSFAAAFAPILSYVAPVLNTLINLLATAAGYINQFFSALGGGSTFIRAKKINEDYAKSLKKTGGAAGKAGNEAKKALAPFDDLVQIQQQGNDASEGGGAGGVDPSQMFETATIEQGISDFANQLKEMFAAGDWEGIGQLIGQKINEAVQGFTQFISWDNIGAQITAFVTAFTTMFNSLVATIDWYAIGIMFGTGINTLANTLYLLLTQIDWFMLGNALGVGLMGMVDTIDWNLFGATIGAYFQAEISGLLGFVLGADWGAIGVALATCLMGITGQINWEQLGYLFAAGLNGAFAILLEFASTFDWTGFGNQIATSISTLFQTFDWAQAGEALSTFVIGILDFLITVVQETDWASFVQGIVDCIEAVDWIGLAGKIFTLLSSALGVAFGALAKFIGTLIADGFAAAKDYFNGKIEECGGNVWAGMLKGIVDAAKGVVSWIKTNVVDPFINGVKAGFGIHSPSTVMAEMGQYLWDGFCNGVKEFFSDPGTFIKENITDPFVNGIKSLLGIHSPSTVMEGVGNNTVAGFNQGVTNGQSSTQGIIQSWASGVASWFSQKLGISTGSSTEAQGWAGSTMTGFNSTVGKDYKKSQPIMENWALNIRKWFVDSGNAKGINAESWKKFADDVIKAFGDEITSKHIETQKPTETWANNVRKWFIGEDEKAGINEKSWTKFAENIINAFKEKIESSHTETQGPMETWVKNVKEWFWGDSNLEGKGGMYEAFYNMAKRINEGFAQGISDFAYMAKDAIRRWAEEAMEEAEEEFDINSPSKEFHAIAEYVVKGFNNGIQDMARTSRNTVQSWLDGVLDVFEGVNIQVPVGLYIPNAAAYLPKIAKGSIVPPRAGEAAWSTRNTMGYAQEDMLSYLISRIDEVLNQSRENENQPVQLILNFTGNLAELARILKPKLDDEAKRRGVQLIVVGD